MATKYTEDGDRVTLEMSRDDFERLLFIMSSACGAALVQGDRKQFYSWLDFANKINTTNPRWTPFEIPSDVS
jgi:hypothetical protein